ncbi:MAG: hypothetical protein Q7S89_00385 [bacterium]|nr:hypothetical protein [bacterium]
MKQAIIFSVLMFLSVYVHIFFIGILGISWIILPLLVLAAHAFLHRRGLLIGALVGGLTYDIIVPGVFGIATCAFVAVAVIHRRLAKLPVTEDHPLIAFSHGCVGVLVFFLVLGIGRTIVALFTAGQVYDAVSHFPYLLLLTITLVHGVLTVSIAVLRELILRPKKSLVLN